ncbi:MAG: glycosyltransferase [Desulfovibrionaceae bacterium]|nr:glycosyltransferase [Desulfovibrionaceae bacterium]
MDVAEYPLRLKEKIQVRILVILPMYGGSLPLGRYCATALESLGEQVRVFEAPVFYSTFMGLKELDLTPEQLLPLERAFLQVVSQAIWAHVQAFEPHLVLAMAQAPLNKPLLGRLQKLGIRTCMWFVEDFRLFQYWKVFAPLYDVFAVIQKDPLLQELSAIGQKRALYLPLAADPTVHKKSHLTQAEQKEYGADVGFVGAGYPNRRLAFRPLAGKNFKIWGSDWENEPLLAQNIQRQGQRIAPEECVKIYSATTVNLNLHSSVKTDQLISLGDFVNPRTFELAAIQAFQLVDHRSLLAELFAADEIATFTSMEEFYAQIEFYLHHPEERTQFIARSYAKVLEKHTYVQRMQTLLDFINDSIGFPTLKAEKTSQEDLGEYAKMIKDLLTELNAGPKADFAEVVARLRRASGQLSELETSILFLDEFRKQYIQE